MKKTKSGFTRSWWVSKYKDVVMRHFLGLKDKDYNRLMAYIEIRIERAK